MTVPSRRADRTDRTAERRSLTIDVAIVCSAFGALAHFVATPSHYTWWPAAGVFFVVLGVAQSAYAVALLRGVRAPWFVLGGIWGTVAVVLVYVTSRTVGLPLEPPVPFHGGRWVPGRSVVPDGAKYVGPLDIVTLAAEILVVITMLTLLPRALKDRVVNRLLWIGVVLWGAGIVGLVW